MLEIKEIDGPASFALIGRLDTNTAPELEEYCAKHLSAETPQDVIVDMAECEFVSSAGLRIIVAMQKHCSATKGTLVFRNTQPDVLDVFKMTGFNQILTLE